MKRQIATTADNSKTLFVPELDEHYHSVHGALQESLHVFIKAGLHECMGPDKSIRILEVGFGTGLNAWLSLREAMKNGLSIHYTALEKYPVLPAEIQELNYTELLPDDPINLFDQLHHADWEQSMEIFHIQNASFHLHKKQTDLKNFEASEEFDLVYFDAFAPSAQPDLWTEDIFKSMFHALKMGGLLVTYCVKGDVRRAMKATGFEVEKIPGPPGKREMARAWKKQNL